MTIIWSKKWCWTDVHADVEVIQDELYAARVTYKSDYVFKTFDTSKEAIEWATQYINRKAEIECIVDTHIECTTRHKDSFVTDTPTLALASLAVEAGIFSTGKACELFRLERSFLNKNIMNAKDAIDVLKEGCVKWEEINKI